MDTKKFSSKRVDLSPTDKALIYQALAYYSTQSIAGEITFATEELYENTLDMVDKLQHRLLGLQETL